MLTYSSVNAPLGYLHLLTIMSAAMNMIVQTSLHDPDFNSFGPIPRNGISFFFFSELLYCFP